MKSREIYKKFELKINKNDTNEGISIPVGLFVMGFNIEAELWESETLKNEDDASLQYIQELLETDFEVKILEKNSNFAICELPTDLFRYEGSYSLVDKDECTDIRIYNFEKKTKNLIPILADDFSNPSLDYEEAPCIVTKDKLKIYFDDYQIKKTFINYYRKPVKIDLAGYVRVDGTTSTVDVDSDLSDSNIESILNRMALEVKRQNENQEGFYYAKDRMKSEIK